MGFVIVSFYYPRGDSILLYIRNVGKALLKTFGIFLFFIFVAAILTFLDMAEETMMVLSYLIVGSYLHYYYLKKIRVNAPYRVPVSKSLQNSFHIYFLYVWYVTQATASWYYHIYGDPFFDDYTEAMPENALLMIFLALIIAPIFEELLCRGVLFYWFRQGNFVTGVFVSTVIFVWMHGTLIHTYTTSVLGLIFCLLYFYTGKLRYVIGLHFYNNFLSLFFASLVFILDVPVWKFILLFANLIIFPWGLKILDQRIRECLQPPHTDIR